MGYLKALLSLEVDQQIMTQVTGQGMIYQVHYFKTKQSQMMVSYE